MSDDQEGRASGPDETRHFSPFHGDDGDDDGDDQRATAASGQNQPDDGPQSGDAWVFDRTDQTPRTEAMSRTEQFPGVGGEDDATTVTPRPPRSDATSIMPPIDDRGTRGTAPADPNWGASNPPWAGRAEVRAPRPGAVGDYTDEWAAAPSGELRGKWWMPIIVGIAALVLLALLGWGVWLIVQSSDKNTPGPAATVTVPPAPKTTAPTVARTTQAPTPSPSTTDPTDTEVTIPALKGLSRQDAQQALSRRGLASRLRFVVSDDAPANTVIDSDPAEGQEVPSDTTVTLIIAVPPTTAPATTASTTAPTNQPDED
jgi:hypothetical protein